MHVKRFGCSQYILFFLQEEGGIRYIGVTGFQTCPLPISMPISWPPMLDSTLLTPVGYPAANTPTQNMPRKPATPCTATAPTTSSTRIFFSIHAPAQTTSAAVAIASK